MTQEKFLNKRFCEETRKLIRKIADKERDLLMDYDALGLRMDLIKIPAGRHIQLRKDILLEDLIWLPNLEKQLGRHCEWSDE